MAAVVHWFIARNECGKGCGPAGSGVSVAALPDSTLSLLHRTIDRPYPELAAVPCQYLELLHVVVDRQASLIAALLPEILDHPG